MKIIKKLRAKSTKYTHMYQLFFDELKLTEFGRQIESGRFDYSDGLSTQRMTLEYAGLDILDKYDNIKVLQVDLEKKIVILRANNITHLTVIKDAFKLVFGRNLQDLMNETDKGKSYTSKQSFVV